MVGTAGRHTVASPSSNRRRARERGSEQLVARDRGAQGREGIAMLSLSLTERDSDMTECSMTKGGIYTRA